ncbi:hypothetical protein DFJ58DRAFT_870121 [Suillus subalutaceus]|uniref:uncharacterized protein n=1 Tax=Suillus subalutaceus TaxID=48586 RepID=UPI001B85BA66|nr:uncharacterized protein DFJ58DRAFT_870121 [Suillus subalutaceus]KAG1833205.1 hypothetical protein DFJ58DRAFT_870121 [Suillus subalutaceus]
MSVLVRTLMLSRWSPGANRVQVDADIKVLVMLGFLAHLQGDSIRNMSSLLSLTPHQSASKMSLYVTSASHCLLIENEVFGLTSTWPGVVRAMREVDPAIAVYPAEHLKSPAAHAEVQNRGFLPRWTDETCRRPGPLVWWPRCLKSFATRIWNTKVNCFKDDAAEIAKIDEEMVKIVVDVGVYLPSHPDGSGIDVDRKSSRPIQSHSKASVNNDPLLPQKK